MLVSPRKAARLRVKEVDLHKPMQTPIEVYPAVIPKYLPLALNHALAARTMSRGEMARTFGIDHSYLTRIFQGKRMPTMDMLSHMVNVNVDGKPFFGEEEKVAIAVGTLLDAKVMTEEQGKRLFRIMSLINE